ncbi:MAG: hypothetical protein LBE18_12335 [Planctomycetaceae bacterium]|nr:hypothetical protein [Planctomycetaceae bacterium]
MQKRPDNDADTVSNAQMKEFVDKTYKKFDAERKKYELAQTDKQDMEELKQLETEIKNRK